MEINIVLKHFHGDDEKLKESIVYLRNSTKKALVFHLWLEPDGYDEIMSRCKNDSIVIWDTMLKYPLHKQNVEINYEDISHNTINTA